MPPECSFWPGGARGAVSPDIRRRSRNAAGPCDSLSGRSEPEGDVLRQPPAGRKSGNRRSPDGSRPVRSGHELGNHTSMHPCSCNFGFRNDGYCLENLGLDDIARTIDEATEDLNRLFPEQQGRPDVLLSLLPDVRGRRRKPAILCPARCPPVQGRPGLGRTRQPSGTDRPGLHLVPARGRTHRNTRWSRSSTTPSATVSGRSSACTAIGGQHLSISTASLREVVRFLDV